METQESSISELYKKYGKTKNKDIESYLNKITLVIKKGEYYYPLVESLLKKIKKEKRKYSVTWETTTEKDYLSNLNEYKKVVYLVKSSSRFILKPDIGEIFDQIDGIDLNTENKIKAICINSDYQSLDGTGGEDFLMNVTLLN